MRVYPEFCLALFVALAGCRTSGSGSDIKLVDGVVVDSELEEFGATLMLYFNGSPCTGQHIGDGYVLTAAHCSIIPGYGDAPHLRIKDIRQREVVELDADQYVASQPDFGETLAMVSGGETYEIPVPDLLIIRPRSEAAIRKIRDLPRFTLSRAALHVAHPEVFMLGFGRTSYDGFEHVDGKLRLGRAGISDAEEKIYSTVWKTEIGFAGGAPGDSGGPLMSFVDERLILHGVASSIQRLRNAQGATEKVWTNYTRIDRNEIANWITDVTGISYADENLAPDTDPVIDEPDPVDPVVDEPGEGEQFVGIFRCQSPDGAAPYWIISMDFNDPVYAKVKTTRYASETSEVTPQVQEWSTDHVIFYGPMLVLIIPEDGGRILFDTESNIATLVDDRSRPQTTELRCSRL